MLEVAAYIYTLVLILATCVWCTWGLVTINKKEKKQ